MIEQNPISKFLKEENMKRGLVFTATLAALTLGLVACGGNGGGTPVKDVTINNKDVLQADWYVEDADRNINMSIEGVRIAEAIDDGDLVVTSSDSTVFTVATSMQKIHAVGAGTATLTATYKNKKSDSVDIEVKVRPAMRVVTHIDTSRDDYFLRYKVDGVNYFATDEMSGFYIKPVLVDEKKEVKVQEDASPVGDYKYTITIGEKMIGAYSGTHKNIGFVGEKVEDDGAEHNLEKALFKFTDDYRFATNYFGSSDYYLAAYGGASTDRIAFQEDRGTYPASAFLKLVEYGEPVPATGVTLDKSELSLHAGAQEKLTATIAPADSTDEIVWSSSNEEIAKVSQGGVVTGVKESSTPVVITAAAGDFSATCTVTVLEALNYGTKDAPLTVEQAKKFLDDYYSDGSQTAQHMFVTGVVSDAGTGTRRNIWLQSSDGATAQFFESYSTICDEGIEFPEVGDTISVEGYGKIYGTTYELTSVKIGSSYDNPTIYNVKKGEKPALTGVSVSPKTSEVNLNGATAAKEVTLTAAPVPSNAELGTVTWECSDADVKVANGVVSIPMNYVAEGAEAKTLTVTAKVGDFSDSATITVKNESQPQTDKVTLNAESLLGYDGSANVAYEKDYKNSTIDGVEFTYQQIGAYKSGFAGMQFRNKLSDSTNGTKSNLHNTAALSSPISSIGFTWFSTKDIKTNSNVLKITFDTVATFDSGSAEVVMLNTVAGEKVMSVAPTGTSFTFVKIEIDDSFTFTCYWDSIVINL